MLWHQAACRTEVWAVQKMEQENSFSERVFTLGKVAFNRELRSFLLCHWSATDLPPGRWSDSPWTFSSSMTLTPSAIGDIHSPAHLLFATTYLQHSSTKYEYVQTVLKYNINSTKITQKVLPVTHFPSSVFSNENGGFIKYYRKSTEC